MLGARQFHTRAHTLERLEHGHGVLCFFYAFGLLTAPALHKALVMKGGSG